ncbi:SDR family oxidoreductase [Aromatoleum toluclasticum]|uniref:SDR family oxidoreductase n=1 Tax=Aromatoleum toluclasticum TaxID=92003 RepID=UPI001D195D2E|nr:SDR family oxidoreductase [Aromatoleum toluclasticum]MCC4117558.1 SDR family oxidoreductase [Aromatoleum toluclasticum]
MGRLDRKVVLVTGGASGVGREDVLLMAREGATVVLTDRNVEAGEALAKEVGDQAMFLRHDVSSEEDWQAVMAAIEARFGRLDAVVNNAGILESASLEEATLEHWQRIQRVNADSAFLGCKYGVLALKERGGSIVNMASVSSWLPVDGYAAYSASKAAVGAVTRAAALHCRKRGYAVRVNSVHPDGIYTPMMQASAPGVDPKYMLFDPVKNRGGRACMPDEIANVVLFLVSDESRFVSGAEIRVDNAILGMGL